MVQIISKTEKGQGLVEYALILVLVSMVVFGVVVFLGPTIGNVYSQIMSPLGYVSAAPEPTPVPLPGFLTPRDATDDYCFNNGVPSYTWVNVYTSLTEPTQYYIAGIHGTGDWPPDGFAAGHSHLQCP